MPLQMSPDDFRAHKYAQKSWICAGEFKEYSAGDTGGMWKVCDHDHITGEYRGAAHSKCNMHMRIDPYRTPIPVFFIITKKTMMLTIWMTTIGRTVKRKTVKTDKHGSPFLRKDSRGRDTDNPMTVLDGGIS